jgi:hypothetical protein
MKNSKQLKFYALAVIAALSFSSCTSDESELVNEEELITTVTAVYTPVDGGTAVTLTYRDLDGDGSGEAVITVSGSFEKDTTYNGVVTFTNESTDPEEDITAEIVEEGVDHQLFYQTTGDLNAFTYATTASNYDEDGNVVGLESVFTTTEEATGTLTITLIHQPTKTATNVSSGDITNAGGSTDAEVTFSISVL